MNPPPVHHLRKRPSPKPEPILFLKGDWRGVTLSQPESSCFTTSSPEIGLQHMEGRKGDVVRGSSYPAAALRWMGLCLLLSAVALWPDLGERYRRFFAFEAQVSVSSNSSPHPVNRALLECSGLFLLGLLIYMGWKSRPSRGGR